MAVIQSNKLSLACFSFRHFAKAQSDEEKKVFNTIDKRFNLAAIALRNAACACFLPSSAFIGIYKLAKTQNKAKLKVSCFLLPMVVVKLDFCFPSLPSRDCLVFELKNNLTAHCEMQ
jgi:hypothetical protein